MMQPWFRRDTSIMVPIVPALTVIIAALLGVGITIGIFLATAEPKPEVTDLEFAVVRVGGKLDIRGKNLGGVTKVLLNAESHSSRLDAVVRDDTRVTALIEESVPPGFYELVLKTDEGETTTRRIVYIAEFVN